MATLNLGRIKPVFQGAYNNSTAYVVDDIVTFGDETFICIQASTGNATSNASYWTKLAAKGTDGTDVGTTLTTQGDILYRDGSGLQRLGAGTNGQALLTGGAGANPSWGDVGGGVVQMKTLFHKNTESVTNSQPTFTEIPNFNLAITPTSASNKILVQMVLNGGSENWGVSRLYRNGSAISDAHGNTASNRAGSSTTGLYNQNADQGKPQFILYLDSPNSTSAQTYSVAVSNHSNVPYVYRLNRSTADSDYHAVGRYISSIVLTEIDGGIVS